MTGTETVAEWLRQWRHAIGSGGGSSDYCYHSQHRYPERCSTGCGWTMSMAGHGSISSVASFLPSSPCSSSSGRRAPGSSAISADRTPDPSQPGAKADDEAHLVRWRARRAGEVGGTTVLAIVGYADIGGDLAGDLVTQAQAGIDVGQAAADLARRVVQRVEIHLDLWLEDQALGQQQVVAALELGGQPAFAADITGRRDMEEQWRQSLYADRAPSAAWLRIEVVARADQRVEIGADGSAVEELLLAILDLAVGQQAFRSKPDAVL